MRRTLPVKISYSELIQGIFFIQGLVSTGVVTVIGLAQMVCLSETVILIVEDGSLTNPRQTCTGLSWTMITLLAVPSYITKHLVKVLISTWPVDQFMKAKWLSSVPSKLGIIVGRMCSVPRGLWMNNLWPSLPLIVRYIKRPISMIRRNSPDMACWIWGVSIALQVIMPSEVFLPNMTSQATCWPSSGSAAKYLVTWEHRKPTKVISVHQVSGKVVQTTPSWSLWAGITMARWRLHVRSMPPLSGLVTLSLLRSNCRFRTISWEWRSISPVRLNASQLTLTALKYLTPPFPLELAKLISMSRILCRWTSQKVIMLVWQIAWPQRLSLQSLPQ